MRSGWVYIMTNRPNGTLYTGVAADEAQKKIDNALR
jgi:predicted GIY-YIG superfamily endonuclease